MPPTLARWRNPDKLGSMVRKVVWTGLSGCALATLVATLAVYPRLGRQPDGSYLIPTGQRLTPAGRHVEVNDRPLGLVLSSDGRRLAVITGSNFAPRALHLIDAADPRVITPLRLAIPSPVLPSRPMDATCMSAAATRTTSGSSPPAPAASPKQPPSSWRAPRPAAFAWRQTAQRCGWP